MVDVFISYSRDNKARVADIAAAVTAAGYDVWWDAELPPHRSYGDVITEKIGSAKAAIVVWSQASAQSEWVRAEADVARNQKKLVQTAIDDVMPPLPFNQIQFADLSDWTGDPAHSGWRKVLMSLEELCGREAASVPPPRPIPAAPPPMPPFADPGAATPPRSSFLPWVLLGVAVVAVALLAWKLTQPAPVAPDAPPVVAEKEGDAAARPSAAAGAPTASAPAEAFTLAAVIDDPDGFTNIRAGRGTRHAIIGKVLEGETFLTYRQPGAWWRVRKADGTTGFMYRKYIRLIEDAAAPAVVDVPAGVGGSGVVIPDSSERLLSPDELRGLSAGELRIARNEIFARHGFRFSDPALRAHFGRFDWYRPASVTVELSDVEKANVALLRSAEAAAR
ncbi:TIR domain-containing protein [Sphingopyxis sp. LK2115]|jgi:hypothetical protein|uniref:TIR domain-containing protein n=1 Tax=Sphingopyxis sp. LK2115 TaxID=2744558 RepID=UPI001660ABD2|nr:YARHG domain-containing protein [Sphingopyxis sp. LK2115]